MDAIERARMALKNGNLTNVSKKPQDQVLMEKAEDEQPVGQPIMEPTDSSKIDKIMQQTKNAMDEELERTLRRAQFLEENEKNEQMLAELQKRFEKPNVEM